MSRNIASTSRRHWLKQGLALSGASLLPGGARATALCPGRAPGHAGRAWRGGGDTGYSSAASGYAQRPDQRLGTGDALAGSEFHTDQIIVIKQVDRNNAGLARIGEIGERRRWQCLIRS